MCNRKFLEELFLKHTPLHNKRVLRTMFDKLAHASIMRLNASSMDKLYDLMVMSFKWQVLHSRNPHDLIGVTLNHVDAIMDYARSPQVKTNIELAHELLIQTYCPLTTAQMQSVRFSILNFLRDTRVRVSFFLQDKKQSMDGTFLFPPLRQLQRNCVKPGSIRHFNEEGEPYEDCTFDPGESYRDMKPRGGLGLYETGNRGTDLGLNMYANCKTVVESSEPSEESGSAGAVAVDASNAAFTSSSAKAYMIDAGGDDDPKASQQLAKEELNLLAKLIGGGGDAPPPAQETFKLSLFDKEPGSKAPTEKVKSGKLPMAGDSVRIDLKSQSRKNKALTDIIGQMTDLDVETQNDAEEDLLTLMDRAK